MSNKPKLPSFIRLLDMALTWIALVCGGATLLFMTAFSVLNVLIMRKMLNSPIIGAEDLLILALVVIVALSIALGARTGAHIEIEVLESHMSVRFAKWSMILMKVLGIVLLIIMAWQLWHAGVNAEKFGETTQQLLISYKPFYFLLTFSIALYALVLVLDIWQILRGNKVIPLRIGAASS